MLHLVCPAKINLFLHVTGKLENGYHTLDSLVCFTSSGDVLQAKKAPYTHLTMAGRFATALLQNNSATPNTILHAHALLEKHTGKTLPTHFHLIKNIPFGAGLGGGSADAAGALNIINTLHSLEIAEDTLHYLGLQIGADVPTCLNACKGHYWQRMQGIGEILTVLPYSFSMPIVLAFPNTALSTNAVFKALSSSQWQPKKIVFPETGTIPNVLAFLQQQENSLEATAIQLQPVIQTALSALQQQQGCQLARMSGSGSCCFGIFDSLQTAQQAAREISSAHPEWWVAPMALQK